jgi:hypothetical protein
MEVALGYLGKLRDSLAAAGDKVPMRVFKRVNDDCVYMALGSHVARRESLDYLPEEVLGKIATLMALGEGSVDGVGVALSVDNADNSDCRLNHLELYMVALVDKGLML